jgi:hypothetical protein
LRGAYVEIVQGGIYEKMVKLFIQCTLHALGDVWIYVIHSRTTRRPVLNILFQINSIGTWLGLSYKKLEAEHAVAYYLK